MGIVQHERSKDNAKDDWQTPEYVIEYLEKRLELPCTLDVCADDMNALAPNYFTEENSALGKSWITEGFAFCNPPYNMLAEFLECAANQYRDYAIKNPIVMLVPPRTDTIAWHKYAPVASELVFIRGRISFIQDGAPKSGNGAASCFLVYSPSYGYTKLSYIDREDMKKGIVKLNRD